jgi:flagellin
MSVRINTNVEALNAQRSLGSTAGVFARSVERLSSGLRINRAADDAAGLAISETLTGQVAGLNQAHRNAQDGVSMLQTAEGALVELHSMLQRIRELSVQAANSTLSKEDAGNVSAEINALQAEMDRIAGSTVFNGQHLLTGALSVSQSGGSLSVGAALNTGHSATIAAVDVSGAMANATYTMTWQVPDKVTLSDGLGNSQQVTLSTIGATGTEVVNFDHLGVKITIAGDAAKTGGELAADLATGGLGAAVFGGASPTDLVDGDTLDSNVVVATGAVTYSSIAPYLHGLDDGGGATPVTAQASAGISPGAMHIGALDDVPGISSAGHIVTSLNGETFTGDLAPVSDGATSTCVLTGDMGHTITLTYTQAPSGALMVDEAFDLSQSDFVFTNSSATVANIHVGTAAAGTYTFTNTSPGTLTLTGPGGTETIAVNDTAASTTQHLDFSSLGISFDISASGAGTFTAESAIANLLSAANDTIVVNAAVPMAATLTTGVGTAANFQIGANASDFLTVSFADARTSYTAGYGTLAADITAFEVATGSGSGIVAAAKTLIVATDNAIRYISTTRGNLGALQNRLEHTTASVSVAAENLTASLSRIRDLDVASEMVNFTKTRILQQAALAVLGQAITKHASILELLR